MEVITMREENTRKERKIKVGDTVFFVKPLPMLNNVRYDIPNIKRCFVKSIRKTSKGFLIVAVNEGECYKGLSQFFWKSKFEAADAVRLLNRKEAAYVPNSDWVSEYMKHIVEIR